MLGGYNLASLVNEYLAKKETWLVLSILSGVVLLIIALIVIFLRKRIVIAIALVKEGSKYVRCDDAFCFLEDLSSNFRIFLGL